MNLKRVFIFLLLLGAVFPASPSAEDKIRITTTTNTLAVLAKEVAREKADIYYIASPSQNIHFISPTPKDVLKTKKADVFIHGGLDLEIWRGPLLDAVGKKEFITGERSIDASLNIPLVEAPHELSRVHGDVHAHGNPHYSKDPGAAILMVQNITEGLCRLYPESGSFFRKNAADFTSRLEMRLKDWQTRMLPFQGASVVPYHNSWIYFLNRFGLEAFDYLEPKPGIPPSPKHIKSLIERMKQSKVRVVIREIFNENGTPKKVAKAVGAGVIVLASEPDGIKGDYLDFIEHNVSQLEKALQ